MITKYVTYIFLEDVKQDTSNKRIIFENGFFKPNYQNEGLRKDLVKQLKKFKDFKIPK